MNELEQLKDRINQSGKDGIRIDHIRQEFSDNGNRLIELLLASGDYIQRKAPIHSFETIWAIFHKDNDPSI